MTRMVRVLTKKFDINNNVLFRLQRASVEYKKIFILFEYMFL